MKELLLFRRMITPVLIQIFFWIAILWCVIYGFIAMFQTGFFHGLLILVGGSLMARVYAEIILLFFKINDNVKDIKDTVSK